VAVTHSIGVILCGYVFLGGAWNDALPWLLSLPLLLAIMPSITLSGIPDLEADAAAGKRTLAVRLGQRGALMLALSFTLLAGGAGLVWQMMNLAGGAFEGIAYAVIPHAALLSWLLAKRIESGKPAGRIDGLMAASLTYVLWFGLFPLFRLAG
jgi:1,4-dihydroxy-2-naphthoate octaprenyltransferase